MTACLRRRTLVLLDLGASPSARSKENRSKIFFALPSLRSESKKISPIFLSACTPRFRQRAGLHAQPNFYLGVLAAQIRAAPAAETARAAVSGLLLRWLRPYAQTLYIACQFFYRILLGIPGGFGVCTLAA